MQQLLQIFSKQVCLGNTANITDVTAKVNANTGRIESNTTAINNFKR